MLESQVQAKILKYLKMKGIYTVKTISTTKAGVPDILACVDGKFLALEVKTPEKKTNVSTLQKHNIEEIQSCGGHAYVVWSVAQVEEILETL